MNRGEPAEMLWGGFFLFSWVSSALLVLTQGLLFKRHQDKNGSRMILDLPAYPREGHPCSLTGLLDLPGILPSLRIHHRVTLTWTHLRRVTFRSAVETGLRPRAAETVFPLKTPLRGRWQITQAAEITDFFAFFLFRCPGKSPETLTIVPEPSGESYRVPRPNRHSSLSNQKKESAEEFYEARKYYPGDDPRKINWKLYAHSRELFIRIGEEGVPKLERVSCLLLAGSTREPLTLKETDRITARFLREILLLYKNSEAEILILAPGLAGYTPLQNPLQAASLLADVRPGERPETDDPVPDKGAWIVVSPPGDPELGTWLRKARDRGIRPSLILFDPVLQEPTLKEQITRFLFTGPQRDPVRERMIPRKKRAPLWVEGERLTAAAGGGLHVRTE